ncbi:unnamed protein product [Brassica rapa subsp. narinosa]
MRFVTNVTDLASEDYYDYIMPAEERRDVHSPPRSPNPVEFVGDRRVHRRSPSSPEIAEFAGDLVGARLNLISVSSRDRHLEKNRSRLN